MLSTITAIDPLPSDPNVLRLRVDGRIVARLGRKDVEAMELAAGQPWTKQLAERVQHAVEVNKARKAALAMLGRRALSRSELVGRLENKGHEPPIAEVIADELEADGWLDDQAYAQSIAHEVMRNKPASAELLVQKMQSRGIDAEVAQRVAGEVLAEVDPVDAAVELANTRLRSMTSLPRSTAARRIAGALARRGFDEETVQEAIHRTGILEGE